MSTLASTIVGAGFAGSHALAGVLPFGLQAGLVALLPFALALAAWVSLIAAVDVSARARRVRRQAAAQQAAGHARDAQHKVDLDDAA